MSVTPALFTFQSHVKPNYCFLASKDTDSGVDKDIKKCFSGWQSRQKQLKAPNVNKCLFDFIKFTLLFF